MLLEVVPDDKNNILYKMLVGKLYNAGIKRKSLEKAFGVTRTTMQRWGRAVKKRKEKEMLEALAGPGFPRKLTDVMERYIKERFAEIYAGNRYSYSKKLIIDIEKVFGKKISSSTIRPILSTIKKEQKEEKKTYIDELNKPVLNIVDNSGNPLTFGGAAITNIKIEEIVQNNLKEEGQNNRQYANSFCISTDGNKEEKRAYVGELSETAVMNTADNSSYDNSNIKTDKIVVQNKLKEQEQNNQQNANSFHINTSGYELCHHAGVLIFSSLVNGLKHLSGNVSENVKLIKQWIVGILLGAMNIEQTKLLDFNSVEVIIGKVIRSLETQRERLVKMSEEEQQRNMVLKYNGEIV
ncbi:MAG: hypothetical protein HY951_15700, partial [Bacteroidia bacterium]|nr:hypothetical protein [Bacteroidia bacterium]